MVTFLVAAQYTFVTNSDDCTRAWVGDSLVVDKWETGSVVPGSAVRPDYGLVTKTADDSTSVSGAVAPTTTATMTYQHPWLGQTTASTVDPDGLALKTATTFEQPMGRGGCGG